jgi:chemotaxis signal transduction protein
VVDTVSDIISVDPKSIRPVPVDPRVPNNADMAKAA